MNRELQEKMLRVMRSRRISFGLSVVLLSIALPLSEIRAGGGDHNHSHHHDDHHEEAFERGPQNGRLFRDGEFALELQIFESGVPPQYRIYGYVQQQVIKPENLTATVSVTRLGRASELFVFEPQGEFLVSKKVVSEPHSFDVTIEATFQGKSYRWSFSSVEGRTELSESVAGDSGVRVERASSRELVKEASLRGKVIPKERSAAQIVPRFPGILRESRKNLGDSVQRGEVVAVVESNESLQPFEVRSPLTGVITASSGVVGEFIGGERALFEVQEPGSIWGEFLLPLSIAPKVPLGQSILIRPFEGTGEAGGVVTFRAPFVDEETQSQIIRVALEAPFLPGTALVARVPIERRSAPVAVKKEAVFTFRDWQVVFRRVGTLYEATPIELGMSDGEFVEVLSGLESGDEYVTENGFLIKADILKSGASHDH